jgi:hypothetical protein
MKLGGSGRIVAVVAAAGCALLLLAAVMISTGSEIGQPSDAVELATSAALPDETVATVDGEPIERSVWREAVLVDQVMSGLAGVVPPAPEETLDRLINERLVINGAGPDEPSTQQIEATIAEMENSWNVNDDQVASALEQVGLGRDALEKAVARVLMVQQSQEILLSRGHTPEDWLAGERSRAAVTVYDQLLTIDDLAPTAPETPTADAPGTTPIPDTPTEEGPGTAFAPDFTLRQVGAGDFTLSEQLSQGTVVLVFFQKCG